uniref:low-density lipoprotein receptor-related protein 6 isoform X2 n=1 Tax=Ciona intestinalis TaxID=7719 RepID=UPI000EF44B5B|nr:low-density lipoprotein receptor-related protein 6 isoform X2 [Ciona intestinalis]|eukprot:XP_026694188.1 low-density lipoprotein receptor-related protein 6 isoform X2 [Ciona intestinalis]
MKLLFISFLYFLSSNASKDTALNAPFLLLANHVDIRLIPSGEPNNTVIVASDLKGALACDFFFEEQHIYWIDCLNGRIQYVDMTTPQRKKMDVLVSGMVKPEGLACDWIGRKLYWTDRGTKRIEVSELDGSHRKVLLWNNLDLPRAIAVDPHNRYMYWTDWGEEPKIERSGMDGSQREVLINQNIYWPNGITLDYEEGKVYWIEAGHHFIHRINLDGSQREEMFSSNNDNNQLVVPPTSQESSDQSRSSNSTSTNIPLSSEEGGEWVGALEHPYAITLFRDRVYWSDWRTSSLYSISKNQTEVPRLVKGDILSPMDLQAYNSQRQKPGPNPCGSTNGGCSHLCLLSPKPPYYKCACPTGVQIMKDRKTCKHGPDQILLLARRTDIRMISLDTDDHTDVLLPVKTVLNAVTVDYDPVDKFVYWTDEDRKAILRCHLNGTGSEAIITENLEQSDGMAIDWVARNLYWTDTGRNYVAVARLNGTSRRILIETEIDEPRAIVVDPTAGYFYWTDWGENPKIERVEMDGTNRILFVRKHLKWPNGLAIDHTHGWLYWADASLDKIERIKLDGTQRKMLVSGKIPHIFGFSILGNYLYWADWQRRRIERMRIGDPRSREILIDQLPNLMGVKATGMTPLPGTNPCARNNGGCSHLCLYTPEGPRCSCPTGLELAINSHQCVVPEAYLLYSLPKVGGIKEISLDTAQNDKSLPFNKPVEAYLLDFSVDDSMVYWTNTRDMTISRAFMNGSNVERFIDIGIEILQGVAVDWIGRNVFWADAQANRIEVARMDGTSRRPIIWQGLDSPACIAMDPANGYIYWSEWGTDTCIKRANLDGSNVVRLTQIGDVGRASSLTIDYEDRRIYWVDYDSNMIMSSDMEGRNLIEVINVADEPGNVISSLTLYGEHVYWADSKQKTIQRANKLHGASRRIIETGLGSIDDMLVFHASRQIGVTSCSRDNGGCQYLCLSLPGGNYTCECPAHYTLNLLDNSSCVAPLNFLLVSQTSYISRIVFESSEGVLGVIPGAEIDQRAVYDENAKPTPDAVLPIKGLKDACSIDYDPIERTIYWIDCATGEIKSCRDNGTDARVLVANRGSNGSNRPHDLAVEPYTRHLYWTDSLSNSIQMMNLNGTMIGTVLSGKLNAQGVGNGKYIDIMPRKITIDSMKGRIYFSNTCHDTKSCRFKILQSALDGSDCIELFSHNLHNVSAMVVDSQSKRLYWSDPDREVIEWSNTDGSHRTTLIENSISQPVGLAVFGDSIYWVDSQIDVGVISGANKIDGSNRRIIQSRVRNLKAIAAAKLINLGDRLQHPCFTDNGGCSHICVPQVTGVTRCSCPTHLAVIEDSKCGKPVTCGPGYFRCKTLSICIPMNWKCDSENDCEDASDEMNCETNRLPCKDYEVECKAGDLQHRGNFLHNLVQVLPQCVNQSKICDGTYDCISQSDEMNCDCGPNLKVCPSGQCVAVGSSCDCTNCQPILNEGRLVVTDEYLLQKLLKRLESFNKSNQAHKLPVIGGNDQDNSMVIVIGIVCGCVVLLGIGLFIRHCMTHNSRYPQGVVMFAPHTNGNCTVNVEIQSRADTTEVVNHQKTNGNQSRKKGSTKGKASINLSFHPSGSRSGSNSRFGVPSNWQFPVHYTKDCHSMDRPCVPGASRCSSIQAKVFSPTTNPPPSPATVRSGSKSGDRVYSTDSGRSHHRCKNGYKHRSQHRYPIHHPPPPTPCNTDTCDDVDRGYRHGGSNRSPPSTNSSVPHEPPPPYHHHQCCYHCYHQYPPQCRHPDGSSSSSYQCEDDDCSCGGDSLPSYPPSYNQRGRSWRRPPHRSYLSSDLNSDSDPFAPPPTPRSQYMSECCYTHGETTEADDPLDEEDETVDDDVTNDVTENLIAGSGVTEDEEGGSEDDADTVLLNPRSSPSVTERSFRIYNPPPSPATDSS